jgi:hypothetical protein
MAQDEYELRPTHYEEDRDVEPLLPRYTAEPGQSTSIKLVDRDDDSIKSKRDRATSRRTVQCIGVGLLLSLLSFGLAGCLIGRRTLDSVRGWEKWEQVPPDWREWLNSVIPPERQRPDNSAFPTK